jgi:hypothetical protein
MIARRTSSQLRSSNSWGCLQHHTRSHTTSGGFTMDNMSVSTSSVMSYGIHPFKDEVVCYISPLDVCDVVLGQPYMWKRHDVYESRPCSVIITLGGQFYRIPKVVPDYCSTKTTPQGNLSYCKIHPLHSLFKGCIEDHYNHCSLNTFYPTKIDCRRERRYCFFTYNGAYTMPHQTQRQQVGGTDPTPPATGL